MLLGGRKKYNRLLFLLSFIGLQIISGFKIPIEGDSEYYADLFVEVSKTSFKDLFDIGIEKGFLIFFWLLSFICKTPQGMIFWVSAIMNILVLRYINKHSEIKWLSLVLYVTLMYFFNAMNLFRFALAYTILLYSNKFIIKRQFLRFTAFCLIAASFHVSVLLYLILYFVAPLNLNIKNMAIIAIPAIILMSSFASVFGLVIQFHDRFSAYGSDGEFYQSAIANVLMAIESGLVVLFCLIKNRRSKRPIDDFMKLGLWSLFISFIFALFAVRVMILIRFATLFSLISIIVIPNTIARTKTSSGSYWSWAFLFVFVTILKTTVILSYRPEWYFVVYKNLLLHL